MILVLSIEIWQKSKKFNSKNASFTQLNRGILNHETMQLTHKTFELAQQIES